MTAKEGREDLRRDPAHSMHFGFAVKRSPIQFLELSSFENQILPKGGQRLGIVFSSPGSTFFALTQPAQATPD
jgi:hypothetical protein